jgi:hypothetical protein
MSVHGVEIKEFSQAREATDVKIQNPASTSSPSAF